MTITFPNITRILPVHPIASKFLQELIFMVTFMIILLNVEIESEN